MHAFFNFGSDFLGYVDSPSVQPNRLSCLDESLSVVVNGHTVTLLGLDYRMPEELPAAPDDGNVVKVSFANQTVRQRITVADMAADCSLQGVCRVDSSLAYAVDSRSNIIVARQSGSSQCDWEGSLVVAEGTPFSGGYSAIAPLAGHSAATIHYLSKQLQWADLSGERSIRQSVALFNPTAVAPVAAAGAAGSLAVAEGRSLSIWDHRMKENDGCTFRSSSGPSPLWTVLSKDNDVLCAGSDRTVQVYDARTWRLRLNWRSPCKYDIIKLLPATSDSRARGVYVCGLDNEILLCDVTGTDLKQPKEQKKGTKRKVDDSQAESDAQKGEDAAVGPSHAALPDSSKLRISHHRGVRAESCWAGIDVTSSQGAGGRSEDLVGICDGGKLYVVHNADKMNYAE